MREKVSRAGFTVQRASYANAFLVGPVFLMRRLRALFSSSSTKEEAISEFHLAPGPFNGLLTAVLGLEAGLVAHVRLPVGVTLLMRARKN
jgi:hypothetical protein